MKRGFLFIIMSIFIGYFGVDGILFENTLELFSFVGGSILLLLFAFAGFLIEDRHPVFYIRLSFIILFALANIVLAILVYNSFGWRVFKRIGSDKKLVNAYKVYQTFVSLLKMDIFLTLVGVLMLGMFLLRGANIIVDVALVVASIIWAVITTVYGVRRENFRVMLGFFAFAPVEPIYIIVKYIVASVTQPDRFASDEVPPVIVFGTFALICRVVLVILSCFVIRNFGKGLLEVFHKESTNKMDYDAIPVYVQDDEYAAYETLM
ncbi:uncharacterized protein ACA1_388440 [Acanthamoeba castellanii str. Neff]|uniref:DUF7789 domain-containing protein n=1 Tax=Acanthamoeba castellanii (strain ATCC 30010 / Neff) TaxID=1257118 RepID=L8GE97_ACACF|nr:uncharacterized protein ACA1_388440 [Acanthamoeba castellanii str. Neff]ELR11164.1 hypothetical protein ACA1_388440 [Acanthamoeba castellanii str. Neff]